LANAHGYRNCVACGKECEKSSFYRIVRTEEGYQLDRTGKADGRGAYVCKNTNCIQLMFKKKSLNHSFHASLSVQSLESLKEAFIENGEAL